MTMTLIVAGVTIAVAVASAPFLDKAADQYSAAGFSGIDRTITGSVSQTKRYTIRRSVLDDLQSEPCEDRSRVSC